MKDPIFLQVIDGGWLGLVGVAVSQRGLRRLRMGLESRGAFLEANLAYDDGDYTFSDLETSAAIDQIRRYLAGDLREFSLPIDWTGVTRFQKSVLLETLRVPYGETRTYGEIAAAISNPLAARAVGQAEKSNQVPLVIPCHRVIGSDGSLRGYGGPANTALKARLIAFEKGN